MKPTLLRILKNGLPAAAILAILGYYMADLGMIWVSSQPGTDAQGGTEWASEAVEKIRYRMPIGMALWGFGLIAAFELALYAWRGSLPPPAPPSTPSPSTDELLNKLLEQAEAARNATPQPTQSSAPSEPEA